jgi:hypothetical protein
MKTNVHPLAAMALRTWLLAVALLAPSLQAQTIPNPSFEAQTFANPPGYASGNGGVITGRNRFIIWPQTCSRLKTLRPNNRNASARTVGHTSKTCTCAETGSTPGTMNITWPAAGGSGYSLFESTDLSEWNLSGTAPILDSGEYKAPVPIGLGARKYWRLERTVPAQ